MPFHHCTLGYEDLNDHEQLRHDAVFGALLGKLGPKRRSDCAALAGKSTLNRLELHAHEGVDRYHKIRPRSEAIAGVANAVNSGTCTAPTRHIASTVTR